ncbi:hypothetical protein CRE_08279 [Caenorhabditis remanei]|uniref:Uncharacterized protein n=1 Tax=Caenorhabditis remanei TaxID=31234 RepID=E3M3F4_CAERE|nr:hypothetical protein CRE_08279 [Caenorhabditis remanei]
MWIRTLVETLFPKKDPYPQVIDRNPPLFRIYFAAPFLIRLSSCLFGYQKIRLSLPYFALALRVATLIFINSDQIVVARMLAILTFGVDEGTISMIMIYRLFLPTYFAPLVCGCTMLIPLILIDRVSGFASLCPTLLSISFLSIIFLIVNVGLLLYSIEMKLIHTWGKKYNEFKNHRFTPLYDNLHSKTCYLEEQLRRKIRENGEELQEVVAEGDTVRAAVGDRRDVDEHNNP